MFCAILHLVWSPMQNDFTIIVMAFRWVHIDLCYSLFKVRLCIKTWGESYLQETLKKIWLPQLGSLSKMFQWVYTFNLTYLCACACVCACACILCAFLSLLIILKEIMFPFRCSIVSEDFINTYSIVSTGWDVLWHQSLFPNHQSGILMSVYQVRFF